MSVDLKYPDLAAKMVCICGDTHGDWNRLLHKLDHLNIKDCILIHVGDIGIGFKSFEKQNREIELVNDRFKKRNIDFYGIAGNHDDPSYFQGHMNFSHFTLLPNYSHFKINGEKFLFVGGAISIDRALRVPSVSWWPDEEFVLKPDLCQECDVLITHTAPNWIGPNDKAGISNWCARDTTLWDECVEERRLMNELFYLTKPKRHFCGHFHCQDTKVMDGCVSRILDILEIYEYRTSQEG